MTKNMLESVEEYIDMQNNINRVECIAFLRYAISKESSETVILDKRIAVKILGILQKEYPQQIRRKRNYFKTVKDVKRLGNKIISSKRNEKAKALREAAKTLGWNKDPRILENSVMLFEYCDLIKEQKMDKKEAIKLLTKKYKIQSWEATLQRLKRAKKRQINSLKAKNLDYSYFIGILPPGWPEVKPIIPLTGHFDAST